MRFTQKLFVIFILCFSVQQAWALTNTSDYLIVESGDTFEASGEIYKNVSIVVKAGGRLSLPINRTDSTKWSLRLVAPAVYIGGTITANGAGFNTLGLGVDSGGTTIGAGGSGFGGKGGKGNYHTSSGGPTYDTAYRENPGTKNTGSGTLGGGGSIRIDAMSLTLAANSVLIANASSTASGGGASGGCIYLNGIHSYLYHHNLSVNGGRGQTNRTVIIGKGSVYYPGGGGGGGGRIKIMKYASYTSTGGTHTETGGAGGGGTGGTSDGYDGYFYEYPAPTPVVPTLLAPVNDQTTGLRPTFSFVTTDPQGSKFIQYQIQISTVPTFVTTTVSSHQLIPLPGWSSPYYASGQMASYTVQSDLSIGETYYWRLRATNARGGDWTLSSFSSSRKFKTIANNPPAKPTLLAPTASQNNVFKLPSFQVLCADPNGNSLTFSMLLSKDPTLSNPQIFQPTYGGWDQPNYAGITATCQLLPADALEAGTQYYWQVTASDEYLETKTSDIGTFTLAPIPTTPSLISPTNATVVTTDRPVLLMSATSPSNGPLKYKLELSGDDFQTVTTYLSENGGGWSKPQYASGETATLQIVGTNALVSGQTYTWQVSAYDLNNDNWSLVSAPYSFTVNTPPVLPQLLSPSEGYHAPNASVSFAFQAASASGNTLTYRLQVSSDNFGSYVQTYDQNLSQEGWSAPRFLASTPATFTLPATANLARGKTYQWRIQAWDGFSWSPQSESRTFSVADALELSQVKLFPSPAVSTDTLHIVLHPSVDAEVKMQVFNAQAKEIQQAVWTVVGGRDNDYAYPIGSFAPGPYFAILTIQSGFGTKKITQRFVVVN